MIWKNLRRTLLKKYPPHYINILLVEGEPFNFPKSLPSFLGLPSCILEVQGIFHENHPQSLPLKKDIFLKQRRAFKSLISNEMIKFQVELLKIPKSAISTRMFTVRKIQIIVF